MNRTGFKLNHWKLVSIMALAYIVIDVGLFIRDRLRKKQPVFCWDFLKVLLGGD